MSFEHIGIRPARILLPAPGVKHETWACIACDQYTSEPAYWEKAYACGPASPATSTPPNRPTGKRRTPARGTRRPPSG